MHIVQPGLYKARRITLADWQLQKSSEFPGRPDHQVEVRVQVDTGTDATVVVQELIFGHLYTIFYNEGQEGTGEGLQTKLIH